MRWEERLSRDTSSEKIRAFVAVRLGLEVELTIGDLIAELREYDLDVRWVNFANLHLTLKFLGPSVPMTKIHRLKLELEAIASDIDTFEIEAAGLGAFPNWQRPSVLWVGMNGDRLAALAARIDEAAARCDFELEGRPFHPHLTIGRFKRTRIHPADRTRIEEAKNRAFGTSTIREMTLYRSITASGGAMYDALAKFQFKSPK